jgi:hypothetical protein
LTSFRTISLFGSLLLGLVARAGDDSVQFKPRSYKPSKPLRTNVYEPKKYSPKPNTLSKQKLDEKSGEYKPISDTKTFSGKTMESSESFKGKTMESPTALANKDYKPNDPLFPSTITADKAGASQEKKQFLVSSNSAPFIVTERPKERNPLLEPRQGIKAPEETPEVKDFSP